jgi:cell division protein FtsB
VLRSYTISEKDINNEKDKASRKKFFRKKPGGNNKLPKWAKRTLAVLAIVAILYFFLGGKYGMINYLRFKHYENTLQEKLDSEKARSDSLKKLIQKLQSDTLYLETLAREKLNMVKPGEKVIIFKESQMKNSQKPSIDTLLADSLASAKP